MDIFSSFFPSFFLSVSLRFITSSGVFFYYYYEAPCEDIYVHVHFSRNSLSAGPAGGNAAQF